MKKNFNQLFYLAKKQDRRAQKIIFEDFSSKMLAVANSYVNHKENAEDILMVSFCKAFQKIEECKSAELFPFWLRKIVVNDAINFIRKTKNVLYADVEEVEDLDHDILEAREGIFPEFNVEDLLIKMPIGYKLVFNLYVFENKKHQEIAQILNIQEGTSRSQLNKAKKWLSEYLKQHHDELTIKK